MEPITHFVSKYGPDLIKPKPEFSLQRLCFNKVEPMFDQLEDELKIQFLVHCASLKTWCDKSRQCSPEVMNAAAKVLLGKLGFRWINEKNAFNKLLAHLFDQAIRHPSVTQKEIDELIEVKRSQEFPLKAVKEKSLSIFEQSVIGISSVWNYSFNFNVNGQPQAGGLRMVPFVVETGVNLYLHHFLIPKLWEKNQPKVLNFMINHFSEKIFPIAFKTYDWCWYLSWLPYLTTSPKVHFVQDAIYQVAIIEHLPGKLIVKTASLGAKLIVNATDIFVPALEKVEGYSEMARYRREINEIKFMWIRG
jgi:hypothetical protein